MTITKADSISWIGPSSIDGSFADEVPLIPGKTEQAILDSFLESAVNVLFEFGPPNSWAVFRKHPSYRTRIKKLFQDQVLKDLDIDLATEILDNAHENDDSLDTNEMEKLFSMFRELAELNKLLEEIRHKIYSCLKP